MAWWVRPGVTVQFLLSVEYLFWCFQQFLFKCSADFYFFLFSTSSFASHNFDNGTFRHFLSFDATATSVP